MRLSFWFPLRNLRGSKDKCESLSLSARDSQSATHNLCIFVPLKASLATSLMPFLVSRLSGEKSQVSATKLRD